MCSTPYVRHFYNSVMNVIPKVVVCLIVACSNFLSMSSSIAQTAQEQERRLLGEWVGTDDGDKVTMILKANGEVVSITDTDGIEKGTYVVDFSATPARFTIHYEAKVHKTIIEFLSANKIRVEGTRDDGERPTAFTDFVTFERQ
jgi:hypothetical protein